MHLHTHCDALLQLPLLDITALVRRPLRSRIASPANVYSLFAEDLKLVVHVGNG